MKIIDRILTILLIVMALTATFAGILIAVLAAALFAGGILGAGGTAAFAGMAILFFATAVLCMREFARDRGEQAQNGEGYISSP